MANANLPSAAAAAATGTSEPAHGLAEGPVVLIGRPPRLHGSVLLHNRGSGKLKIKSATLHLKDMASGDPHNPRQLYTVQVAARLAGGGSGHAPLLLPLGAATPAGTYHGEIAFEALGERREAVVQVLEHRAVSVRPSHFELFGRPGGRITVPVVLTNLGNVAFLLPKAAALTLGEDNAFNHLFHAAMARKGGEGHQAALDAFTELLAASEVESGRVVFAGAAGHSLAPGGTLATEVVFELPERLSRRRAYVGGFNLGRHACSIELEVDLEEPATAR